MDQVTDEEMQRRLDTPGGRYFLASVQFLERLLRWREAHEAHDHADPEVKRLCERDWGYLEHEGKVLIGSGPT